MALYRKLLLRKPLEESRDIIALAGGLTDEGKLEHAEGLLRLVLAVEGCNVTHPEASWKLAALLLRRRQVCESAQLLVRAFGGGYGSAAELFAAARQLHLLAAEDVGAAEHAAEDEGVAPGAADRARIRPGGASARHAPQQAEEIGGRAAGGEEDVARRGAERVQCLHEAARLYKLVLEKEPRHTVCAVQLAHVTYRLLRIRDETSSGGFASLSAAAAVAGATKQRAADGMWGEVLGWLRQAIVGGELQDGMDLVNRVKMVELVHEFGVLAEKEGQVGDAVSVLSLVAELRYAKKSPASPIKEP